MRWDNLMVALPVAIASLGSLVTLVVIGEICSLVAIGEIWLFSGYR